MAWLDLVSHFDDDVGSRTKLCWCGCGSLLRKMKGGGDKVGLITNMDILKKIIIMGIFLKKLQK